MVYSFRPIRSQQQLGGQSSNRSSALRYIKEGVLYGNEHRYVIVEDTLVQLTPEEFDPRTCGRPRRLAGDKKASRPEGISREDWKRRYIIWSRYDEGIQMDRAAWFEVTPENIARFTAEEIYRRYSGAEVVDGCAGVGGNAIQFALNRGRNGGSVVACDISRQRLDIAKHNAEVYGVKEGRIRYVEDDVRACKPTNGKSVLFLSPPWGGKKCYSTEVYDPASCQLTDWATSAACQFNRVVLYLPRHTDLEALVGMCRRGGAVRFLEILIIRYTSPEPHTKALLVFLDRKAEAPVLPVPPLVFWRGSVTAALLRTVVGGLPAVGRLWRMVTKVAGDRLEGVQEVFKAIEGRNGMKTGRLLEEADRIKLRRIELGRVALAVVLAGENSGTDDVLIKLLSNLT